ncbi:MAG: hypothetical protein COU35_00320 [Candidatus Magasanikbacteria bacterium CG10_big_fil_rev_8_21_14_0_10_47_10]|uniref:Uncharacterized protein n=1 Tax=Candidatus Magasanikbacteria bacterium CG10_big_fil_rev_8_21_14_0_10_47_10 TaxID=1974652 RepID=A0A2H0TRN9_9BACT|nr:MAG: hypothetical protein COU35_00320 [Candidatus Magasanikbacteria bacterium CG10_big_fil_rev_8_21_14_0_10_47_10]
MNYRIADELVLELIRLQILVIEPTRIERDLYHLYQRMMAPHSTILRTPFTYYVFGTNGSAVVLRQFSDNLEAVSHEQFAADDRGWWLHIRVDLLMLLEMKQAGVVLSAHPSDMTNDLYWIQLAMPSHELIKHGYCVGRMGQVRHRQFDITEAPILMRVLPLPKRARRE